MLLKGKMLMDTNSKKHAKLPLLVVFILLFTGISTQTQCQNRARAEKTIDTLCSPYFGGRGYVNFGHKRAASFIAESYLNIGLDPVFEDFFNPFEMQVNVFPGAMNVSSKSELIPGYDFIVHPYSPSVDVKCPLITISKINLRKRNT
jgi:hypothetical protein